MPAGTGIKCKSYVSLASVFTEIDDISDENINYTMDEAAFDRRSALTGESLPTIRRGEVTLKIMHDPTNTVWDALHTAYWNQTSLEFLFLDSGAASYANGVLDTGNTSNGTQGERWTGCILNFSKARNLGDAIFNDVTIKPALNANVTIFDKTTGNITYTAPGSLA